MGACHVVRKAGTPTVTSTTPFDTGDHYVDTLTGDNYRSEGTSTPADWILESSSAGASGGRINFWNDNVTSDKYLKRDNNHASSSDVEPFVCAFDLDITALTFINKVDSATIDLEIEKNGSVIFTWSISAQRRRIKTNGLGTLQGTFSAGDKISVFAKAAGGTSPDELLLDLVFSYTSSTEQEIGSATL